MEYKDWKLLSYACKCRDEAHLGVDGVASGCAFIDDDNVSLKS